MISRLHIKDGCSFCNCRVKSGLYLNSFSWPAGGGSRGLKNKVRLYGRLLENQPLLCDLSKHFPDEFIVSVVSFKS